MNIMDEHHQEYYQDFYDEYERSRDINGNLEGGLGSFTGGGDSDSFVNAVGSTQSTPTTVVPHYKPQVTADSSPEEEHFCLLVFSIKILHSERDPEFGVEVNLPRCSSL
jgi:hypothetical protein